MPAPSWPRRRSGAWLSSSPPASPSAVEHGGLDQMSDQPEQPEAPDGETVTTPAGAAPPVPMRTPAHGRGKLLVAGQPGNKGGGRHPQEVLGKLILIGDQTCDELLLRLNDPKLRARMSADQLRSHLGRGAARLLGAPLRAQWSRGRPDCVRHGGRAQEAGRGPPAAAAAPPAQQRALHAPARATRRGEPHTVSDGRLLCRPVAPCCIFTVFEVNSRN